MALFTQNIFAALSESLIELRLYRGKAMAIAVEDIWLEEIW